MPHRRVGEQTKPQYKGNASGLCVAYRNGYPDRWKGLPNAGMLTPPFCSWGGGWRPCGRRCSALTEGPGGLCLDGTQGVSAASRPPSQCEPSSRVGFPYRNREGRCTHRKGETRQNLLNYTVCFGTPPPLTTPSSTHAQLANGRGQPCDQKGPDTGS